MLEMKISSKNLVIYYALLMKQKTPGSICRLMTRPKNLRVFQDVCKFFSGSVIVVVNYVSQIIAAGVSPTSQGHF